MLSPTRYVILPGAGGKLSYATWGPSSGFPILFLHGISGSRLEPVLLQETMQKKNIFLVAPEKGAKTVYAKRLIESWMDGLDQASQRRDTDVMAEVRAEDQPKGMAISEGAGSSERPSLPSAAKRELLVASLLEGFAQGSGAAVEEARLLTEPWRFPFEDVDYNNIIMWHGANDTNAPIGMIRWMAERMPHCVLHELPEDPQYTIGNRLGEILDMLTPTEDK